MNNKPTMTEHSNGTKHWLLNEKLHREDGPAIVRPNGTKAWYLNGKRHREDGPAIESLYKRKEWWLNGKCYCDIIKGKLHNNNFLVSDRYIGLVIIMGGKERVRFMKTTNNKYFVIEENNTSEVVNKQG
jgi:hypothetical protein